MCVHAYVRVCVCVCMCVCVHKYMYCSILIGIRGSWNVVPVFPLHTLISGLCCREGTMRTTSALLPGRRWGAEGSDRVTATFSRPRAK